MLDPDNGERRLVLRERVGVLSTLSVGAPFGDAVIIGSIDQHRIGVCQRPGGQARLD